MDQANPHKDDDWQGIQASKRAETEDKGDPAMSARCKRAKQKEKKEKKKKAGE